MSAPFQPAAIATQRVTLKANGQVFQEFIRIEIDCDLDRVARSFDVTIYDQARMDKIGAAFDAFAGNNQPLKQGMSCTLAIDGTVVLVGYIVTVDTAWSAEALTTRITGLDKCGDLVECAAAPNGAGGIQERRPALRRPADMQALRHRAPCRRGYRRTLRAPGHRTA